VDVDEILAAYPFRDRTPAGLFRAVAAGPDAVAVIDAGTGETCTYAQLSVRAAVVAATLTGLGARPGDRVVWSAPTGPDAIAIWMGIAGLGCVDVCTGESLKGVLLEHVLADSQPRFAVLHSGTAHGLGGLDEAGLARFSGVVRVSRDWPGAAPDRPRTSRGARRCGSGSRGS